MSHSETHHIAHAFLTSHKEGVVELSHDWKALRLPPIRLEAEGSGFLNLRFLPRWEFAAASHYFVDDQNRAVFIFDPEKYPEIDYKSASVYVAGDWNGWQEAIGKQKWRLTFETVGNQRWLVSRLALDEVVGEGERRFKFVTDSHHWFPAEPSAPNVSIDALGNANYVFSEKRSGRHRLKFTLTKPIDLSNSYYLIYDARVHSQKVFLLPGPFFFELRSDKALGALVEAGETVFRLFAPRAKWVKVGVFRPGQSVDDLEWVLMEKSDDFVWEARFPEDLTGARYWFRLDGLKNEFSHFDPDFKVLDPYAKAVVSREGPGIVIDDRDYGSKKAFRVPEWQDLVVMEAHTRDLVARLPENVQRNRPLGFEDLRRYVDSDDFYPKSLGVNALELQPVQENDSVSYDDYHWGYMTTNFFSPASTYASDPLAASQIEEFRSLVSSLHRQGMAVLLDVVYNHVGEPAHLMYIDKLYYFHVESDGTLSNWSGCGNDLRCEAPMTQRIMIDSLKRFVEFYGVDGFRFDLADLIGKAALIEIEKELKAIKPDIILIAEPWSFRGHIGRDLRDTGFASWNDGYRDFVKDYVKGSVEPSALAYYLMGSPNEYASWPAQTVNYTESHDDRVWIDMITEHSEHNGMYPTIADKRRTHMMAAILMMSIGIPMIHAGQDYLFSKGGVNNTYQRGDLNAMDYGRRLEYASTSDYFKSWISFRKSDLGRLVRHYSRAKDGFFEFVRAEGRNGMVCLYNADYSQGDRQLLFAVNPDLSPLILPLNGWSGSWKQLADHDRFWGTDLVPLRNDLTDELSLPSLGCGLWMSA